MTSVAELIRHHDEEDVATQRRLEETAAALQTTRHDLEAARADDTADDQKIAAQQTTIGNLEELVASLREQLENPDPPPAPVSTNTLFGAGGGNQLRTGIEIDRWYGGPSDIAKAVSRAKENRARGTLTWVSFKFPYTWAEMAQGKGDSWAKDVIAKLGALGFPIWVAFHHEPEGDGDTKLWTAIQDRLSRFVPGTVHDRDLKFSIVVTGWHQEFGTNAAYKWDALWPKGAPVDIMGYDAPYNPYGKPTDPALAFNNSWTEGTVYVDRLAAAAAKYGAKPAIGEYGFSDEAFVKDKTWLDRVFARAEEKKLLGVCYFDTTLNSAKSWTLGPAGSPKRAHFQSLVDAYKAKP